MIRLGGVSHRFGERQILTDIDLDLTQRRIGIVGANGSGKSTLARLLNGLLLPSQGQVTVDGLDTRTDTRAVRRRVGFVFQNPDNQIVYPVVEEDLAFGLKGLKLGKEETARRVTDALQRYGLSHLRTSPSHLLSGGEKQLLALAGVMIMRPAHVVFDEPTTLLDLRNRNRIAALIEAMEETAIVVSHDLDLLRGHDRVIVVDEGRIVADDAPSPALARYVARMSAS